jgi:hypothetical protein
MIDRVIEIANPRRLNIRDAQLVISRDDAEDVTTPLAGRELFSERPTVS